MIEPNIELTGHQRWLLSYADFLTLLFALFAVLFASAYTHKKAVPAALPVVAPPAPLAPTRNLLLDRLSSEIRAARVEIVPETRGLVIVLKDASFFQPGDDEILPESYPAINEIARAIAPLSNSISVEGHADAVAIHNSRFTDNWELSSARGAALLRYLIRSFDIAPQRLSVAAYADTRPLADNASPEGRAQNRRVDIVILSK
jgi:chemotaxis protein MotB